MTWPHRRRRDDHVEPSATVSSAMRPAFSPDPIAYDGCMEPGGSIRHPRMAICVGFLVMGACGEARHPSRTLAPANASASTSAATPSFQDGGVDAASDPAVAMGPKATSVPTNEWHTDSVGPHYPIGSSTCRPTAGASRHCQPESELGCAVVLDAWSLGCEPTLATQHGCAFPFSNSTVRAPAEFDKDTTLAQRRAHPRACCYLDCE